MGFPKGAKGAFGKGKAPYGKGDGKPRGPSGPELERERLTEEKFSGEVTEWRGKFGYIMPSEEVEHEDAKKKGGKLWASVADILSGATELVAGQQVSFHIYRDESGGGTLGAEEIEEVGAPPKTPAKSKGKAAFGRPAGAVSTPYAPAGKAAGKAWGPGAAQKGGFGAAGKGKAAWAPPVAAWAPPAAKGKGKGKFADFGKAGGKGKSKRASGPNLERERLTAEKFAGEVVEWKGKFGYIMPSEPVEHPDAEKHEGKLWVSMKDIEATGLTELEAGTPVTFHIYTDASGTLGADEVEM